MPFKISERAKYDVVDEIMQNLRAAFRSVKAARTKINNGDGQGAVLLPYQYKVFNDWISAKLAVYTAQELKALLDDQLDKTVDFSEIQSFKSNFESAANAAEAGLSNLSIGLDAEKRVTYAFTSEPYRQSLIADLDAASAFLVE